MLHKCIFFRMPKIKRVPLTISRWKKATCTCPKNIKRRYSSFNNLQPEDIEGIRRCDVLSGSFEKFPRRKRKKKNRRCVKCRYKSILQGAAARAVCTVKKKNTEKNNVVNALVAAGKCSFLVASLTSAFTAGCQLPLYSSRPAPLPPVWMVVWTFRIDSSVHLLRRIHPKPSVAFPPFSLDVVLDGGQSEEREYFIPREAAILPVC